MMRPGRWMPLAVPLILLVGLTDAQAFFLETALVLIVSGLAFAAAAEAAALLLAKLPQAAAELLELLADPTDLLLDLLDASIRIAAACDATLLLLGPAAFFVAGLPGLIFLLPALRAALLIAGKASSRDSSWPLTMISSRLRSTDS